MMLKLNFLIDDLFNICRLLLNLKQELAMPAADDVARLFLAWGNRNGDTFTNLKLQKLLYYAQAWYLVNFNEPLFGDTIEAWKFGPVVRSVYFKFKEFRNMPIDYESDKTEEKAFSEDQLGFLDEFFDVFNDFSATHLVNMVHHEGPWVNNYKENVSDNEIPTEEMKTFYINLYKKKYGKRE